MNKIRILLVDDHNLVTLGFSNILSLNSDFIVVGEVENGEDSVQACIDTCPDVILMDINMPGINGIEATKKIKTINENVKIIMLTTHSEEQYIFKSDIAGADGYLFKNCVVNELYDAIKCVMAGEKYYSNKISIEILEKIKSKKYLKDTFFENDLTKREIEIIRAIAEGLNNKQISEKLFISDRTVNTHRTNIMQKMDVKNAVELVVKAIEKKLI